MERTITDKILILFHTLDASIVKHNISPRIHEDIYKLYSELKTKTEIIYWNEYFPKPIQLGVYVHAKNNFYYDLLTNPENIKEMTQYTMVWIALFFPKQTAELYNKYPTAFVFYPFPQFMIDALNIKAFFKMLMVCGWRRSGKDSFFEKYTWLVYSKHLYYPFDNLTKVSIAANLKKYTHTYLQIEDKNYDDIKDTALIKNLTDCAPDEFANATLRDMYIMISQRFLADNPMYWCEQIEIKNNIGISDFRRIDEYKFFSKKCNVFTARLFRSVVPEPDAAAPMEHELDDFTTDYLLVPNEADFDIALKRFPQYAGYQMIWKIR